MIDPVVKSHIRPDDKFLRHFVEWHSRDRSSHIKGLYDQVSAKIKILDYCDAHSASELGPIASIFPGSPYFR